MKSAPLVQIIAPFFILPLAVCLTALSERSAEAGILYSYSGTNIDIQVSDPIDVGTTPLKAVIVTAIGKNGYLPNTFDSTLSGLGGTGITTSSAALHQIWEYNVFATPTSTLAVSGSIPQQLDSHFLIKSGEYSSVILSPTENRTVPSTQENPYGGFGNSMTGMFSLLGTTSSTWSFAYLVVPDGTKVNFNFEIAATDASLDNSCSEQISCAFVVPEPNALALFCFLGLGLMAFLRGKK